MKKEEESLVLARMPLTPEQQEAIAKYAERSAKELVIVKLSAEQIRRLAPGIVSATAITIDCW